MVLFSIAAGVLSCLCLLLVVVKGLGLRRDLVFYGEKLGFVSLFFYMQFRIVLFGFFSALCLLTIFLSMVSMNSVFYVLGLLFLVSWILFSVSGLFVGWLCVGFRVSDVLESDLSFVKSKFVCNYARCNDKSVYRELDADNFIKCREKRIKSLKNAHLRSDKILISVENYCFVEEFDEFNLWVDLKTGLLYGDIKRVCTSKKFDSADMEEIYSLFLTKTKTSGKMALLYGTIEGIEFSDRLYTLGSLLFITEEAFYMTEVEKGKEIDETRITG